MLKLFREVRPIIDRDLYVTEEWGVYDRHIESEKYLSYARLCGLDMMATALLIGAPVGFFLALLGYGNLLMFLIILITGTILAGYSFIRGAEKVIRLYQENLENENYED